MPTYFRMIRNPYRTYRDTAFKGKIWMTGVTRKLTNEEAKPLLEKGIIYPFESKPKRFVDMIDENDNITRITWGEYLTYRNKLRRKERKGGTK